MAGKYPEMVEAEAQRAEAEEGDEPEAEPTTGPEPEEEEEGEEGPGGPTPEQLKALDKENRRHEQALERIVGRDWQWFVPCNVCDTMGFRAVPPAIESPLRPDPKFKRCPDCGGHGMFQTDSLNPERATRRCDTCGGDGIVMNEYITPAVPTTAAATVPATRMIQDPATGQWVQVYDPAANGVSAPAVPPAQVPVAS